MIGHIVDTFVLAFGLVPTAAGIRVTVIQTVPRTHTHTHTLIHTHIHTHTYSYSYTYTQHNWTHVPHILLAWGLVPTAALFFDGGLGITVCQTVSRTHTHTHTLIIHINLHTHTHTDIFPLEYSSIGWYYHIVERPNFFLLMSPSTMTIFSVIFCCKTIKFRYGHTQRVPCLS